MKKIFQVFAVVVGSLLMLGLIAFGPFLIHDAMAAIATPAATQSISTTTTTAAAYLPAVHRYRCKRGHVVFMTAVPSILSQVTEDDEEHITLCPVCLRAALKRLATVDEGTIQ